MNESGFHNAKECSSPQSEAEVKDCRAQWHRKVGLTFRGMAYLVLPRLARRNHSLGTYVCGRLQKRSRSNIW